MKKILIMSAAAAALVAGTANAKSAERIELGVLDCTIEGGSGFIFGSSKDLTCTFDPAGDERKKETYFGTIDKWGVDVGSTDQSVMKWAVLAPTTDDYQPGALAGRYAGVSGEATVGVGLGANALVGGSSETIALQPVSVQAQSGLNFAVGVAEVRLRTVAD